MAIVEVRKGIEVARNWRRTGIRQERGLRSITPEQELRGRVLSRLQGTPVDSFNPLTHPYSQFDVYPTAIDLKESLIDGVDSAQRSGLWSNTEAGVNMGYYNSEGSFYTNLFHEVTHRTLTTLGRDHVVYAADPLPEEEFCWQSSQDISQVLNLPFALQEANILLAIAKERQKGNISRRRLDSLARQETKVRGFSDNSREQVIWTPEGIPQLAA